MRIAARFIAETAIRDALEKPAPALIYGAGAAGVALLREIRQNQALAYNVIGFIDDDARKKNVSLLGVPVLGSGGQLAEIAPRLRVKTVLIAMPSADGESMTRVLEACREANVAFKTVPGLAEILRSRIPIRDVAVEDLLGRSPVQLDESLLRAKIGAEVILVTGAAGSIGSELCRQIARFGPKAIVGFDIAETALFHLEREMKERFPRLSFLPEIGSIRDRGRLDEVFRRHRPSAVFHSAAYKHVPLMETHVFEAVLNNVFGTQNVALAAQAHEARDFVLISSDKAVRPTNLMGVTKRLAELLVRSLVTVAGPTAFRSVRFGNVLGSNGSVVPLFSSQIAAGGPVTVTHPDMERYFMTIPEAAQLVLQASTMGRSGEIFVLDMGRPIRIVDLARKMILLCGLRPDLDVQIEFTGIRPGEKLSEELSLHDESTSPTPHDKIRIFAGPSLRLGEMEKALGELRRLCAARDLAGLILFLKELVPDYNPSHHLLRRMVPHSNDRYVNSFTRLAEHLVAVAQFESSSHLAALIGRPEVEAEAEETQSI